jgi:hypothetical protein
MGGIFGEVGDLLFGKGPGKKKVSGAFEGFQGVGASLAELIQERLATPVGESDAFRGIEGILRDRIGRNVRTGRQQLGESAVATGALDSGQVRRSENALERGGNEALSGGLAEVLLQLEALRTQGALEFASAGANEQMGIATLNTQIAESDRNFALQSSVGSFNDFLGALSGFV